MLCLLLPHYLALVRLLLLYSLMSRTWNPRPTSNVCQYPQDSVPASFYSRHSPRESSDSNSSNETTLPTTPDSVFPIPSRSWATELYQQPSLYFHSVPHTQYWSHLLSYGSQLSDQHITRARNSAAIRLLIFLTWDIPPGHFLTILPPSVYLMPISLYPHSPSLSSGLTNWTASVMPHWMLGTPRDVLGFGDGNSRGPGIEVWLCYRLVTWPLDKSPDLVNLSHRLDKWEWGLKWEGTI